MPIATQRTGLTTSVMFVREGTSYTLPSPGTVGVLTKPDAGDTVWTAGYFGPDVEEFKVNPEVESYEYMGGQPGGLVVTDEIEISRKVRLTFTSQQYDKTALELMFGTLALSASSSQANHMEGALMVKGWLKIQQYDGAGTLRVVGDAWVSLRITDVQPASGRNPFKVTYEARILRSTLNTLAFS